MPLVDDIGELDPLGVHDVVTHEVASQLFEGLLGYRWGDLALKGAAAESWEASPDGRTWTFRLREDLRFQDDPCFPGGKGRRVSAEDVRYSLLRFLGNPQAPGRAADLARRFEGGDAFARGEVEDVAGIEVLDSRTLRIRLTEFQVGFPHLLAGPVGWIVAREAVERYGSGFGSRPVGTGPFRLARQLAGSELVLVRNRNYWERDEAGGRLPYLDKLVFRFSMGDQAVLFDRGELDTCWSMPGSEWHRVYRSYEAFKLNRIWFSFNLRKDSPWAQDARLRRAMNYLVAQEKVAPVPEYRSRGFLPRGIPGFQPDVPWFVSDPERGRALLREAGFSGGRGLPALRIVQRDHEADTLAPLFKPFEEAGIRVDLVSLPRREVRASSSALGADLFRDGWMASFPDAIDFFQVFHSRSPDNNTGFARRDYDALCEAALREPVEARRLPLYRKMEAILLAEAPCVFLWQEKLFEAADEKVMGYADSVNPILMRYYERVWLRGEGRR